MEDSTMHVGYSDQDLPPSRTQLAEQKRNASGDVSRTSVNAWRRHMAPAYLKLVLMEDGDVLAWIWCDARSGAAHVKYISLDNNYTKEQARVHAAMRWDRNERKRVGLHNLEVALYLGRERIINFLRRHQLATPTNPRYDAEAPSATGSPEDDFSLFVQLRACGEIMERSLTVWSDIYHIHANSSTSASSRFSAGTGAISLTR